MEDLFLELGVTIDAQLFELALTHRSWAYENSVDEAGRRLHNERLEFLGDAVLQLVITDHLYAAHPGQPEGQLAKMRAATVNAHTLAEVARSLELGLLIKLGKGEVSTGGAQKTSILADAMEAVIGAVHVGAGRDAATAFVSHLFVPIADQAADLGAGLDWKTSLQELCAQQGRGPVSYSHVGAGPDHDRRFVATVHASDSDLATGEGRSKREAEIKAAQAAYARLQG